jgi:uncharacterized membrane protein YtjA (UPF0391 family)
VAAANEPIHAGGPITIINAGEETMLRWALLFLIVAIIAGALGMFQLEGIAGQISWILFVIFLILFLVSLVFGGVRRPPV